MSEPWLTISGRAKAEEAADARATKVVGAVNSLGNGIGCLFLVFAIMFAIFISGVFQRLDRIEAAIKEQQK